MLNPKYREELEGDLEERFHDNVKKFGWVRARHRHIWRAIKLLRPALVKQLSGSLRINQYGMLKHYLKAGYRSLIRDRVHAMINLLGLAVGMGVCLVIFQYVYLELSYDQFHEDHENIYSVVIKESNSNTQETYPDGIGWGFGLAALDEVPEVQAMVRKARVNRTATVTNASNKRVFYEEVNNLLFEDPTFFQVFNFPLLQGHPPTIFDDEYSIVITASTARKYFGDTDPMGQLLTISGPPAPGDYRVTGVLADLPVNSHLQFEFLMPIASYIEHGWGGAVKRQNNWTGFEVVNYLKTESGADPESVKIKLNELIARNTPGEAIKKEVILQPIADIHLGSNDFSYPGHINETGSLQNITIFSVVALFILLIAWTNYINLAIAQSLKRRKEVGIRKAMGAYRKQLVGQFLLESVLINFLAGLLAIGIGFLLLPVLGLFIDKELGITLVYLPSFWLGFIAVLLLGSVISGLYPAFVLSRFRPINALKERSTRGKLGLRQGLIVFQFLTSLLLISATYLVYRQTAFMKDQELGMDFDRILVVEGPRVVSSRENGLAQFQVFRDELPTHHAVESVAGSLYAPGQFSTGGLRRDLNTPESEAPHCRGFYATLNFEQTYGLEFLAGGPFTPAMVEFDESRCFLNEAALTVYGFDSPEEAINAKLYR
ncbi:MAG: ABC transporter permease, partial [Bacteroidota bacterium]